MLRHLQQPAAYPRAADHARALAEDESADHSCHVAGVPDGGGPGSPALSYGLRVLVRPAICLEAGVAAVPSIGRHGPLDRVPATIAASQPGRPEPGRGFVKPRSTLKLRLKCWGQRSPDERRSEPHGEEA